MIMTQRANPEIAIHELALIVANKKTVVPKNPKIHRYEVSPARTPPMTGPKLGATCGPRRNTDIAAALPLGSVTFPGQFSNQSLSEFKLTSATVPAPMETTAEDPNACTTRNIISAA